MKNTTTKGSELANFNTHLAASSLGSGILATFCYNAGLSTSDQSAILWITGTLAGLLPDVDSNNSTSLKVIFNTLSIMVAVLLIIRLTGHIPFIWLWVSIFFAYLVLRWIVLPVFRKITVHRGSWHTLLTGFCISMFITNIAWHTGQTSARYAWLLGIFTAIGFFIHLALDEIYAFDLSNLRIKRSFGTACKPVNLKTPVITCILSVITIFQLWQLPPWPTLVTTAHKLVSFPLLHT